MKSKIVLAYCSWLRFCWHRFSDGGGSTFRSLYSPVESLGSVKDRIAKFEQFKTLPIDPSVSGPPPSIHALPQETEEEEPEQETVQAHEEPASETQGRDSGRSDHSEQSIPEVHFTESDTEIERHDDQHEESYLEAPVGIVITPHTPVPPEFPEDKEDVEDEQPQEPLEPSEPEHVARAEIKDTREYSDEELAHELSPSEEHVSTAEIKDIKSYSPTSSDDERSSQKGKVSPPIPQVRHVISPSVASEVLSSEVNDDELAAHFVAESFEKHDEGRVESMEHTPIYRGHHSPGQTSPIVSEHPLAQEYAESVTSHDEGDNLSLKSGHEPEIARHSVASVQEGDEEEEKSGLGDYAKKAGMIVGGVIAAPVALAAVGAKAAYDALKKDDEEEEEPAEHEEKEVLTTQTTIMESPIQHEDIPLPHLEDVTPKVSHHEHPQEEITETSSTREYYEEPEEVRESSRASHVESERPLSPSTSVSEKEHGHIVTETTTTTTVTREFDPETGDRSASPTKSEEGSEKHFVTETTTTTTVTKEYEHPDDSERLSEPAQSPEPIGTPAESETSIPHVVETTTTTTVTREYFDDEDQEQPIHHETYPIQFDEEKHASPSGSPIPSERSIRSVHQRESPTEQRQSPVLSESFSEKEAHHVTETTTTTTVTHEYYDKPQGLSLSPTQSAHEKQEHPTLESPAVSEKELPRVVETTTTTTVTREYDEEEPRLGSPSTEKEVAYPSEFIAARDDYGQEYPRPESPAEVYPIPSAGEQEHHLVSETTTTETVTREYYEEPEHDQEDYPVESFSPAPSSHVETERPLAESPIESEREVPHVIETTTREYQVPASTVSSDHPQHVETTTTTTVTREFYGEEPHQQPSESPSAQYFHEQTGAPEQQSESGEESEGEGFGSKVLGFAKKAGMVAGGVVAAPVALAAVGAKAAYDALKKDDADEDQDEQEALLGDVRERRALESPVAPEGKESGSPVYESREFHEEPSTHGEQSERQILESPTVSEKEVSNVVESFTTTSEAEFRNEEYEGSPVPFEKEQQPWVTETTTTTTVTREYEAVEEHPQEAHSPISSSPVDRPLAESPVHSEKYDSYVIETPEHLRRSPALGETEEHLVKETTVTTTVTREFYDEPEHDEQQPRESYSPAPSSHVESEHQVSESPVISEKEHPRVIETTTTTTVTREFEDDEYDRLESPLDVIVKTQSPAPSSEFDAEHHALESPVLSEKEVPHVTETTTTTTVTHEYYEDESYPRHDSEHAVGQELPRSPTTSEDSQKHFVTETTTTTTVTKEYEHPDDSERLSEPAQSPEPIGTPAESEISIPHVVETTTTTTVTREYFDDEDQEQPIHREASPVVDPEQQRESSVSPRGSPVLSEKFDDAHLVKETTTTTTLTREFEESPESIEAEYKKAPVDERKSPSLAESEEHLVRETTTTTTVTREFYDEPEHIQQQPEELYSSIPSSHAELERQEPESSITSEKEFPQVTETTLTRDIRDSPAAQYFHDEPEHHTESPVQSEHAPLLSEQQQPESGEESEGEGFGSKVLGFAKKAGMVAGGVVAAPVALAAVGAKAAYDALKKDDEDEDQDEQEALLGDVRERRELDSPAATQEQTHEPPVHHVTETTTTTTVTREYFDEPEPLDRDDQESVHESEKSIPHVVETKTTTTVTRDFDEGSEPESAVPSEEQPDTTTYSREVYETAQGDEPEHHYIETTTTTVKKEVYDEPEEEFDDGEPKQEIPHVVETTTTSKTTREYEDEEDGSDSGAPHVTETTTTTTVVREFYGDQPEEEAQEPADVVHEETVSPDSESTTSVSREMYPNEPHVIETRTTTTVTREYHDEPEESEEADVKETVISTTTTQEYFEQEPESPIKKEESEDDQTSLITAETEQPKDFPIAEHQEDFSLYRPASPTKSEEGSEKYFVTETTTTTTVTKEYEHPDDSERLSEPAQSPEPIGTPAESEKFIPHVVETTTTTTVTREYFDDEDQEPKSHEEPTQAEQQFGQVPRDYYGEEDQPTDYSPVQSEQPFDQEQQRDSTVAERGSPVPSEKFEHEDAHIVKEVTTTTTVTREFYDEPEHVQQQPEEVHRTGLSSHAELERQEPESPIASEREFPQATETTLTRDIRDSPAAQYFHDEPEHHTESPVQSERAPLLSEQQQPESGEESEGEGFGSKVLGFAKKAGMVAGGVVAAPVALAAVGAKAAYDALKKDDEDQDEQEALLGDVRERRSLESPSRTSVIDSETQEPSATFYEPEEEDKVVLPETKAEVEEPKIVFPADSPAEQYEKEKKAFESMVQAEGPYIVESEGYEQPESEEQRISSPVHSESGDFQASSQQEKNIEVTETPREAETTEADAPYVIDSEEYEFSSREEQRISSPVHSDEEEREVEEENVAGGEPYEETQQNQEEDPSIVESEEYIGSGNTSPRPFEDSTTTTVLSVHHEPPAIPEPEVDEEELEQDRSVIESGEYSSESPLPPTTITTVEHVEPAETHEYTATSPTTVTTVSSEHFDQEKDPFVVESEEYVRTSSTGYERPESPSGSPIHEESHVIESQEYSGSPVPSEDSVRHVVEKTTTTTTTEEHFEPEDSFDDVQEHVKTTTTVTTVTREYSEPEEEEGHVVESEEYSAGSPVPSEKESSQVIETVTTTTVTREHYEPEEGHEEPHVIESQEYSPSGSPVPSEKSTGHVIETTTTTTVTREHVVDETEGTASPTAVEHEKHAESEQPQSHSPVPSEGDVHEFIKTTTTTTTVTREHFEQEDEPEEHVVESAEYASGSPIPSESESGRVIETTTTTTVTREHIEPEEESHVVESQEYSASVSPVPSEKSVGHVIGTTSTTVTSARIEPEEQEYGLSESERQSPIHSEKSVEQVIETTTTTTESHEKFLPEEEREASPVRSEEEVHGVVETTSARSTESHVEPEHFQTGHESGEESDGEGFGSKVLGFAKKAGMVAGGVVAAPVALAAVGAKAAYDALKKDDDEDEDDARYQEQVHYEPADLQKAASTVETHEEKDDSESDGSFVDHGEESQHLPVQSTEDAFKLSSEDVAEQTAEKLVSEVFSPLDRTLIESEQYRASLESLNRRSPVEKKRSVEDLASEALQNVTKISFGNADESDDKHDDHNEEWKVYDRHGEILEEFSTQLTDDVIQEAEGDATTQIMMTHAEYSPRRSKFLKQESCQEISNEPEVDYYSDLQEKLNILAGEKSNLQALIEEEPSSSASDQLDVIHESDQEAHLEREHEEEVAAQQEQDKKEEAAEYTATHLVDEVLKQVVHEIDEEDEDQKTMTSDAYLTATEKDDQEYDTCVTSQDDTYESAQGWTSQDSEYTTATSQAPSRLSDSDGEHTARDQERQETSTPQAILSPVDSDRHFTVQQDFDMPVIRAFDADDFLQTTARSTPDVALQVTIEEEDESDDKLPISPSGILLPPSHDPGRPISPVPPRKTDGTMQKEGDHFVFVREEDTIAEPTPPPQPIEQYQAEEATRALEDTAITRENVPQEEEETEKRRQETERIHSLAMEASSDLGNSESSRYSRQLSDLSSSAESHADTVIRVESERSGSSDSLEVVSVISAGKDAKTSEKSLTPEDPEKKLDVEKTEDEEEHHERPDQEAEDLGFEVYDADTEEQQQQQPLEELETVEEEPEDSDSLNEGGNHSSGHSSVGVPADTLAMIGKYRHQSSDNLSLTSLQEFERLEREVGARGDGSLTRSEIELLVAGRLNKSGEGSVSSLAEFERLEKEMTENQSPPEDVMMLSDIREESEAEDMSIRDDDEEDVVGSDTELKSRPVQEEDLRVITPVAPSPTDSLEHAIDPIQIQYLETSTDSLEPTFQEIEVEQRPDSVEDTSLTEYEMVPRVMEASTTDSLDGTNTIEKDSVLEGASQGIESTQSTHGLLSGDTMGTLVTDDDRDSLDGEVTSMLQSYPTTLTTFQTTVLGPDGSLQTISRRVETRVTDPLISHVTFTGTESQERLDQLPDDEQFETVDTEGNVTRTTFHREHDQQHPQF
uniref:SEA domain-containing protein n=1 Tax=Caenorhabditis tropicalis TaxID=1561998 RepID=A0A1I7T837_9PELO